MSSVNRYVPQYPAVQLVVPTDANEIVDWLFWTKEGLEDPELRVGTCAMKPVIKVPSFGELTPTYVSPCVDPRHSIEIEVEESIWAIGCTTP